MFEPVRAASSITPLPAGGFNAISMTLARRIPLLLLTALLIGCVRPSAPDRWGQPGGGTIDRITRERLLDERRDAVRSGDAAALTRIHAVLSGDALARAARLTAYWLDHRDGATGLFPTNLTSAGRVWTYEDAASDLFPFLAIGTKLLLPKRYDEILDTLTAERRRSAGLPRDIALGSDPAEPQDEEKLLLGATEYAKDGLLPMVELLGREPWLGRLTQVTRSYLEAASTPTRNGPIVYSSTEINGNVLQVLSRLYWAKRDAQYLEMGDRTAKAYLDRQLPETEDVPAHRWDFIENEPIGPRRFFLGDHGNEIVSGLIEWHRVEMEVGAPELARHRKGIRELLDRLMTRGRTPEGLWFELIDVPSGRVRDTDLTDNWGYLAQAYLNQADIERRFPGGDVAIAERYEQTARRALAAAARTGEYPWDDGTMDGYADTIESALYVMRSIDDPDAVDWLHRAMGTLIGFQQSDGRVTDENIDGNFIRSSLLYALWLSQGTRLEPWEPGLRLGAVRMNDCLILHAAAERSWNGSLLVDSERHRENLGLPSDYPRLNQWMEWYAVSPAAVYTISIDGFDRSVSGATLLAGTQLAIHPGQSATVRICRG
jgi:hypothetical protein